jgi:hypothetical protein
VPEEAVKVCVLLAVPVITGSTVLAGGLVTTEVAAEEALAALTELVAVT